MKTLHMTVGAPGSGKSTFAKDLKDQKKGSIVNLNRDDARVKLFKLNSRAEYVYSKNREKMVNDYLFNKALRAARIGNDIIISDTNLNPATREKWEHFALEHGYVVEYHTFDVPYQVLLKRNLRRGGDSVPTAVLRRFHLTMRDYLGKPTYHADESLPEAVVFDVDGTLMNMGDRNAYDWDKVHLDTPNRNVVMLFKTLTERGINCITVSGRDGVCKDATLKHLNESGVYPVEHYQREKDDTRPDEVIKPEIFWQNIATRYNVLFVVDDRNKVVDMWREIGLECWQVNEGDF